MCRALLTISTVRESERYYVSLISGWKFGIRHSVSAFGLFYVNAKLHAKGFSEGFSTLGAKKRNLSRPKGPSKSILLGGIATSLKENKIIEAWETYYVFKNIYGYPEKCTVADLVTESTYSADSKCLKWACKLILSIAKEKPCLLKFDVVNKLALSLARAQLSDSAASVLRVALEKKRLPPLDVLRLVFLHLLKTESGLHLASNMLDEFCYIFLKLHGKKTAHSELTKPDAIIFNLVLDSCTSFGTPLKGQLIIELMAQLGVVGDANSAAVIARIFEMNGMRDELRKLNVLVDTASRTSDILYLQFYDSLLSLHLKFNDIDSASALLISLCCDHTWKLRKKCQPQLLKTFNISIGSGNARMPLKLQFLPQETLMDYVYKFDSKRELILCEDGKLVLSRNGLIKLILRYKKTGRINELSKLLITINSMLISRDDTSPLYYVIDASIHLGWLETAHDILVDMVTENFQVDKSSFASLLAAYRDKKMFREAEGLKRQIDNLMDSSDDNIEDTKRWDLGKKISYKDLCKSIIQNMKEEEEENDAVNTTSVHAYNSSIYFFSKAKMMEDAKQIYIKMQRLKIKPDDLTFFHLIRGYSSSEAYREITFLWGDIKRSMQSRNMLYDRDLYELLLINLIRGGYFERVLEVIGFMRENKMFVDKGMYKREFLRFHTTLYRRLKVSSDAKDETQRRRSEQVMAFRKFVGIG